MFYLIDAEGDLFQADTLNNLMKICDDDGNGRAYGCMEDWQIFQGTKIEVERSYVVKSVPKKPAAKKPTAKTIPVKAAVKK